MQNAIDELAKNYRELQTGADKILKTNRLDCLFSLDPGGHKDMSSFLADQKCPRI
jgi:hypothetical protein